MAIFTSILIPYFPETVRFGWSAYGAISRDNIGEPLGWQIKGVEHENLFIPTRLQQWRIERRTLGTPPLGRIPQADFENSGIPEPCSPWTCVNNCTQPLPKHDEAAGRNEWVTDRKVLNWTSVPGDQASFRLSQGSLL